MGKDFPVSHFVLPVYLHYLAKTSQRRLVQLFEMFLLGYASLTSMQECWDKSLVNFQPGAEADSSSVPSS